MDLTSLLSYRPSLTDYMGEGKSNLFEGVAQGMNAKVAAAQSQAAEKLAALGGGDSVALSEEAKVILNGANTGKNGEQNNVSGTQKAAQNFLMGFFDQSGLELSKLSDEALDFIEGLNGVIAGSGATVRDTSTDMLENQQAGGARKAYTLTGANMRLRIAINYGADGAPLKLSITDINGGKVETAEMTIGKNEDGKATLEVERTQREYRNGYLTGMDEIPLMSMKLYPA